MPSRRDVLAVLAAAPFAGCGSDAAPEEPTEPPLAGRTLTVAGDVPLPRDAGAAFVDTVADADAVLLPAADGYDDTALYALERGTPVVVAGDGAPGYLGRVCHRTGDRYGLPSDGWTPSVRVAAAIPAADRLDVQYVESIRASEFADRLPRAVGGVLGGRPPEFSIADPARPDGGVELGRVRARGRVDAGAYDRWDRVTLLPDDSAAVVETVATVNTAPAAFREGYRVDDVEIQTEFADAAVEATGPAAASSAAFSVAESTDEARAEVTHAFTPENDAARRSLTVGARTVVSPSELAPPFGYVGNVRFRWRRGQLLGEDESWVVHTPGRAVWRRF